MKYNHAFKVFAVKEKSIAYSFDTHQALATSALLAERMQIVQS